MSKNFAHMRMKLVKIACSLLSTYALADDGGLKTSVAVDLMGEFASSESNGLIDYQAKDSFKLRSAEFSFYAPIDPVFDGVLSFAAHPEGDQAFATPEVHEAYISSHKLIDGLRLRAGQYFLGVGRINQRHQHDWPFLTPSLVQKEVFDSEEGIIDTGLEASYILPTDFFLELQVGVSNGRDFGHSHVEDDKPLSPTHYARSSTFWLMMGLENQLAFNYLGRTSAVGERMQVWGFDFVAKKKQYGKTKWLIQSELWKRELNLLGNLESKLGGYLYIQPQVTDSIYLGFRYDHIRITSQNYMQATEINLMKRTSEFTRLALGYSSTRKYSAVREDESTDKWLMQVTYLLGSHPSHEF